jgi:hypothetical protein
MRSARRIVTRVTSLLLPTLVVLLFGEASARVYYVMKRAEPLSRILQPFGPRSRERGQDAAREQSPVVYEYQLVGTSKRLDSCSGRELTFVANEWGGRGDGWTRDRTPGTTRLVAVGGSTTYGVNNPEEATWPALLEQALRTRGVRAEALNFGWPSQRLEHVVEMADRVAQFHPDVVLYYEAANNATAHANVNFDTDTVIERFHVYSWVGRLTSWLHYRSVLYTLALEKVQFALAKRRQAIIPEIAYFQTQLRRFAETFRHHGITPIFVLQVTDAAPEPLFERVDLSKRDAVEAAILQAVRADLAPDGASLGSRLWTYQTQVLVEVVRRAGPALGVQVIDPRPAFADYQGRERLFCDFIHLTDAGNRLLAQVIAEEL